MCGPPRHKREKRERGKGDYSEWGGFRVVVLRFSRGMSSVKGHIWKKGQAGCLSVAFNRRGDRLPET